MRCVLCFMCSSIAEVVYMLAFVLSVPDQLFLLLDLLVLLHLIDLLILLDLLLLYLLLLYLLLLGLHLIPSTITSKCTSSCSDYYYYYCCSCCCSSSSTIFSASARIAPYIVRTSFSVSALRSETPPI